MYRCGTICEILKMTMIVVLVTSCRRISSQVRKYYMHLTKTRTKSVSTETSRDSIVNQNTKCESNRMNGPFLLVLIAWRLSFNCRRWPTPKVSALSEIVEAEPDCCENTMGIMSFVLYHESDHSIPVQPRQLPILVLGEKCAITSDACGRVTISKDHPVPTCSRGCRESSMQRWHALYHCQMDTC